MKKLLFILSFLVTCPLVYADGAHIIIDGNGDKYDGNTGYYFLEDNEQKYSIEQVITPEFKDEFSFSNKSIPNWGFTSGYYWLAYEVENTSGKDKDLILDIGYAFNHHVELFCVYPDDKILHSNCGIDVPFKEREVAHRNPQLHFNIRNNETIKVFIKTGSDGKSILLPVHFWEREAFHRHDRDYQFVFGIYYGILIIIAIVNFFLFVTIRDVTYLYYILYVVSFAIIQASFDGFGSEFLWSDSPYFSAISIPFFGGIATLALMMLTMFFMDIRKEAPKMENVFKVFYALVTLFMITLFFGNPFYTVSVIAINLLAVLGFIPIIGVSLVAVRRGSKPALIFSVAFIALLFGLVTFTMTNLGLLENTFLANFGMKIGSSLEITILSFSLAVRFKYLKEEKEKAQEEQLSQLQEMNRLKDEINTQLEIKVQERTRELAEKNKDILDSINYAKRIQEAILPADEEIKKAFADSFVLYRPKDIVSGDFYWFSGLHDKVIIAAADCTGHGVPGAFMSMIGNDLLNHIVLERRVTDSAQILELLRFGVMQALKQTKEESETKDGMDIALCVYDKANKELQFSGAYNPLYLIRQDGAELEEFKGNKFPIGVSTGDLQTFTDVKMKLNGGDCFYIFSDGLPDQFGGPKGKKFKYKQFKEVLMENHSEPMAIQRELLLKRFEDWKSDLEQVDDVVVIGVRV